MSRPKLPLSERVYPKIESSPALHLSTPCWLWRGSCNTQGYGVLSGDTGLGTNSARRIVYFLETGILPEKSHNMLFICENRACVNPAHLRDKLPITHASRHQSPIITRLHRLRTDSWPRDMWCDYTVTWKRNGQKRTDWCRLEAQHTGEHDTASGFRVLWERINGLIPSRCVVYPINGDWTDVRVHNTALLSRKDYWRMLYGQDDEIRCSRCKERLPRAAFAENRSMCRYCVAQHRKKYKSSRSSHRREHGCTILKSQHFHVGNLGEPVTEEQRRDALQLGLASNLVIDQKRSQELEKRPSSLLAVVLRRVQRKLAQSGRGSDES